MDARHVDDKLVGIVQLLHVGRVKHHGLGVASVRGLCDLVRDANQVLQGWDQAAIEAEHHIYCLVGWKGDVCWFGLWGIALFFTSEAARFSQTEETTKTTEGKGGKVLSNEIIKVEKWKSWPPVIFSHTNVTNLLYLSLFNKYLIWKLGLTYTYI